MSSLDDRKIALYENPYAERTAWALQAIEAERRKKEAQGYAVMAAFSSFGETAQSPSWTGRVVRASKWLSIWFFMVMPVVALWSVVFG